MDTRQAAGSLVRSIDPQTLTSSDELSWWKELGEK